MKLNGNTIVNLLDLQRNFDPLQAYAQLKVYHQFVRIHSLFLGLMIGEQQAEHIKKSFFCTDILENAAEGKRLSDKYTARECLRELLDTFMINETRSAYDDIKKEIRDEWEKEIARGRYFEKLAYIEKDAGLGHTLQDAQKAVVLLAICEMAEMNAENCRFVSKIKKPAERQSDIKDFTAKDALQIAVGDLPYKFWYHAEDTLAEGETIRTVQLTATGSMSTKKTAVIELYEKKSGKMVCRETLAVGECRWLTAAGDRVIGLLPRVSEANGHRIEWEDGACTALTIHGRQSWTLAAQKISCFATAGEKEGFLLLREGRVISLYYKLFDDDQHRIRMSMIKNAVEVAHDKRGYRILTADGRVFSSEASGPSDEKRVSLLRRA